MHGFSSVCRVVGSVVFVTSIGSSAGPASAAEVSDLYVAEVVVPDNTETSREGGLGDALARVITKVTGRRNPRSNVTIANAIASPGRFVQQFRYRQEDTAVDGAQTQAPRWFLWAKFDSVVVDGLIADAGWRIWGRLRPEVMLWVVVEKSGERRILGGEESPDLAGVLRNAARLRGVPVVLPLLDLEDQSRLRVSDVWGEFNDRIQAATDRYQANVIFAARIYRLLPSLWEGKFTLMAGDEIQEWKGQGDILELLLSDAVDDIADSLALRFSGPGMLVDAAGFDVVVSGIRNLSDYAKALDYLAALEQITDVSVTRVVADKVRFQIQARGGKESLRNIIRVGGVLTPENLPDELELRFRLLP